MEPYQQIFPEANDPTLTLALPKKSGKIPKGSYSFTESYCADPGCDCRKVVVQVVNEKNKAKAVINFGFDQDSPFGGPYLDMASDQAPYAADLATFFADALNQGPELLDRLYRHYRQVREKVEGKPYRGKAFPKPGQLVYQVTPPPDLEAEMLQSLQSLRGSGRRPAAPRSGAAKPRASVPAPPKEERDLPWLVRQYAEAGPGATIDTVMWLRKELRSFFGAEENAGEELARLLPELCRQSPQDEDHINAALRLLFDVLMYLGDEVKDNPEAARPRLEKLQKALARDVFEKNEDLDLSAAVWNMLAQSRVEIIPSLRQAVTRMMTEGGPRSDLEEMAGEEIMSGILRSFESMGVTSPFEAADEMLQLFALNEPEMQIALLGEMLQADSPLLRDMAALMIFNPQAEVRLGVSRLLARGDGGSITPETLRRLIISRNWLPEEIRKNVDQTVTKARKSRVECATIERPKSVTVLASSIDGGGAQSFHVVVPDGSNLSHCGVLVKQGLGVGDALLAALKTKGEANALIGQLKKEAGIMESTAEFFDLRICQALAEGSAAGKVPGHALVRVAELLGRDRWRPVCFDTARELLQLWEELQSTTPRLLDGSESTSALRDSGDWLSAQSFLGSWFETGEVVQRAVAAAQGKKGDAVVEQILDDVLEPRRAVWLERLVICALWLKSGDKGAVPWHKMFHVAQAVADETIPLRDIPLMVSIARLTLEAYSATK